MLNTKSFLAVDFGAGSLKLAEFEINEAGGLSLKDFVIRPLGLEGSQEATRETVILKALQETISERGYKSRNVNVCAPGFHVFSKFVKLPPVDAAKVTQIIQYEAQQNVPFPLSEVVWDYQILGSAASGELEVLLVAVKSDIVEGLFRVADQAKLRLSLCDASPAALCNAFRYNYGDIQDCAMLLDIGAKTSNLLFFEKGKVFSRSISLGANSITQDFANESKLKFDQAEKIKIAEGFVSLGGAYEEPENQYQAAISKIARQFMTRLHIQVNQTMQFYRGQQGGSAPQRLFLSGGASIMPYTAQFFAEKLNVPVEYFNPFRNIQIDPAVSLEELARVAHSLGEVVGLGLRNLAQCPVEMNLMPESTLRWRTFNEKKPYFFFTLLSLVAVAGAVGFLFQQLANAKEKHIKDLEPKITELTVTSQSFTSAYNKLQQAKAQSSQIASLIDARYYWGDVISEIRAALIRAEDASKQKLSAQRPGVEVGIWIESFGLDATVTSVSDQMMGGGRGRHGGQMPYTPQTQVVTENTVEQGALPPGQYRMVCRAIDLTAVDQAANVEIANAFETELKKSALFDPKTTQINGNLTPDDSNGTFIFNVVVTLQKPLNL
jgi:type IV pilus assembly protein PilM